MRQAGIRWSVVIGVMCIAGMGAAGETGLRVNADRANLRARPAYENEVVCQAQTGDLLIPVVDQGEWRGVRAPVAAPAWVHADFVTNEQVKTRLNVRGGPGINFNSIALLQKGAPVKVLATRGDWLQIEAPTSSVLWIYKDLVTAVESAPISDVVIVPSVVSTAASAVEVDGPATSESGLVPPIKAPAPPELAAKGLKPEIQQGIQKVWEGQVQPIDFLFNRPGNYRLIRSGSEDKPLTICYLKGNDAQLSSFVGRQVQVTGWEYWLKQTDLPVIVPETIAPIP